MTQHIILELISHLYYIYRALSLLIRPSPVPILCYFFPSVMLKSLCLQDHTCRSTARYPHEHREEQGHHAVGEKVTWGLGDRVVAVREEDGRSSGKWSPFMRINVVAGMQCCCFAWGRVQPVSSGWISPCVDLWENEQAPATFWCFS